jgi:hypothetical protein
MNAVRTLAFSIPLLTLASCFGGGSGGSESPPTLLTLATVPANGALNADPSTLVVSFNRPLDASQLDQSWLTVQAGGSSVLGAVSIDPVDARILQMQLVSSLPMDAAVSVTASASITAQDGTRLGQPFQWSFSTGSTPVGGTSSLVVTSLPDLRSAPAGTLEVHSVEQIAGSDAVGVTWSNTNGFIEHTYLDGTGWSAIQTVSSPFLPDGPSAPDSQGGAVSLIGFDYARFTPGGFVTAQLPGFFSGSMITSGEPLIVAEGQQVLPNGILCASYDPVSDSWTEHANLTGSTLDLDGWLLPADNGGFQLLRIEGDFSTGFRTIARSYELNGAQTGSVELGSSPSLSGPLAVETLESGRSIVLRGTPTPTGLDLEVNEYVPGSGWSTSQLVGNATIEFGGQTLLYARIAFDDDGAALVAVPNDVGQASLIFSRESGSSTWQQTVFDGVIFVTAAVSDTAGFLVGGLAPGNSLVLIGKAPGAGSQWSERQNAGTIGVFASGGLVGLNLIEPVGSDRFLVIAPTVIGFNEDRLQAALVQVQ